MMQKPTLPLHIQAQREAQAKKATERQNAAMAPNISAQVAASAGTGKTHVLTRRFLRLLLADPSLKPSEIVAVTYTKAGATEMHNRLTAELADWAILPQEALQKALTRLLQRSPSTAEFNRARALFALVLDDGIGLRVLTVHSFCQSLLAQFPLEAGISSGFKVLEAEEAKTLLLEEMHKTYIALAEEGPEGPKGWALPYLVRQLADSTLTEEFAFFTDNRRRFESLFLNAGGLEGVLNRLKEALSITEVSSQPEEAFKALEERHIIELYSKKAWLKKLAQSLVDDGKKQALENASKLHQFLAALEPTAADVATLYSVFQTQDGGFRKSLITASLKKNTPELAEEAFHFFENLKNHQQQAASLEVYFKTAAFLTVADRVRERYTAAKVEANKLDFEDLIRLSHHLLTANTSLADWVRFKMDGRICHIMLDEAQDTDRDQWQIIKALMDDFFTGVGQHERQSERTFFAVGDSKQAIYRFRGAERHVFEGMLTEVSLLAAGSGQEVHPITLDTSFRSSQVILQAVDTFFKNPIMSEAISGTQTPLQHEVFHIGAGGEVLLWPLPEEAPVQPTQKIAGWVLPFEDENIAPQASPLKKQHFSALAAHIAGLIEESPFLATQARHLDVGDVMVLCRTNEDVDLFLKALAQVGVVAARSGKLTLSDSAPVQDLVAFLQFLANPLDDVACLHMLRAPFFALEDAELEALRNAAQKHGKQGRFFRALCGLKQSPFVDIASTLKELLALVDLITPHQVLQEALHKTQGIARLMQRYTGATKGPAADGLWQVVEVFMDAALAYSQQKNTSLTGFLEWFSQSGLTLNLQIPEGTKAVRVMTMHGSKGLQAPVVILPETGAHMYKKVNAAQKLWSVDPKTQEDAFFLFGIPKKQNPPPLQQVLQTEEKERVFEDEMRLLYVALTRAQERLVIGATKAHEESWYSLLHQAFKDESQWHKTEDGGLTFAAPHVFEGVENLVPMEGEDSGATQPLPRWVHALPPQEDVLRSSVLQEETVPTVTLDPDGAKIFEKGLLVHRLLEVLSQCPQIERTKRATTFLNHRAQAFSAQQREAIKTEVLNVLDQFGTFLKPPALPEVALAVLEGGQTLKGRVDVLCIREEEVIILDFKTGRVPPQKIPLSYKNQLQRYAALAQKIWPEKRVRCGLLWTATPEIMWL